jgi:hypothetical protein
VAGGRCLQRSSQPGEATADHHHALHAPAARWNGMGLAEEQGCFLEVLHASVGMGKGAKVPHDRGHLLWTPADGPSNRLLASIDRWVGAVLADDGIDMPLMGRSDTATATVLARSRGLWPARLPSTICFRFGHPKFACLGAPATVVKSGTAMRSGN